MKKLLVTKAIIPIVNGVIYRQALLIDDNVILDIGSYKELKQRYPDVYIEDFSDHIIMPGFINAHSHLELSFKDKEIKANSFTDWILKVNSVKKSLKKEDFERAVLYGIEELWNSGVSAVGDISSSPFYSSYTSKLNDKMRGRVYLEFLALNSDMTSLNFQGLKKTIKEYGNGVTSGISPHSSYTLCEEAFRLINSYIKENNYYSAIHVGESYPEEQFFKDRSGSLFDFINNFSPVSKKIENTSPISYLYFNDLLLDKSLLIHLNVLREEEIKLIVERECSVVHCPRSHSYFDNPPFKMEELIKAGINIAIGTDSILSNVSLSFFEELKAMRMKFPKLRAEDIIRMATINGAKALYLENGFGKIETNLPYHLITLYCPQALSLSSDDEIFEYILDYEHGFVSHIDSKI